MLFTTLFELFQLQLISSESCFLDGPQWNDLPVTTALRPDLRVDSLRAMKDKPSLVILSQERPVSCQQGRRRSPRPRKQTRLMSHKHRLHPNESGLPSPSVPGGLSWPRAKSHGPVTWVLGIILQLKHRREQVKLSVKLVRILSAHVEIREQVSTASVISTVSDVDVSRRGLSFLWVSLGLGPTALEL